jgi:hypothetical protein
VQVLMSRRTTHCSVQVLILRSSEHNSTGTDVKEFSTLYCTGAYQQSWASYFQKVTSIDLVHWMGQNKRLDLSAASILVCWQQSNCTNYPLIFLAIKSFEFIHCHRNKQGKVHTRTWTWTWLWTWTWTWHKHGHLLGQWLRHEQ